MFMAAKGDKMLPRSLIERPIGEVALCGSEQLITHDVTLRRNMSRAEIKDTTDGTRMLRTNTKVHTETRLAVPFRELGAILEAWVEDPDWAPPDTQGRKLSTVW